MRLSLNHPVRVFVDSNTDTADNLSQEFVRVKSKKEDEREVIVSGIPHLPSPPKKKSCMICDGYVVLYSPLLSDFY